nr:DUF4440 domain-containing protein [Nannocystis pusilla]
MPLVGAERNFGREVAELGVVDGFTRNLAVDAVLLRPEPQSAAQALAGPAGFTLTWEPAYAEIAASGDLGYTTGPYQAHERDSGEVKHGHYVSVWRKEGERWRVVVDGGSAHPPPLNLPDRFTHAPAREPATSPDRAAELKSLRAAEDALITGLNAEGGRALLAAAAPDLRWFPRAASPSPAPTRSRPPCWPAATSSPTFAAATACPRPATSATSTARPRAPSSRTPPPSAAATSACGAATRPAAGSSRST